ncbi:DUF768 domain-containing protein [Mesorhizobium sp. B3-2-1]|nr:DUF768 domain-containing protein [Mesorhizobium sp. B3-2-1]
MAGAILPSKANAKAIGIKRVEIDEDVDSLYRTILHAIVHDPGLTG